MITAIARGRAWFEELAIGRARSLQDLAKRDGIFPALHSASRCPRLLEPELVEAILQGRQSVELGLVAQGDCLARANTAIGGAGAWLAGGRSQKPWGRVRT